MKKIILTIVFDCIIIVIFKLLNNIFLNNTFLFGELSGIIIAFGNYKILNKGEKDG